MCPLHMYATQSHIILGRWANNATWFGAPRCWSGSSRWSYVWEHLVLLTLESWSNQLFCLSVLCSDNIRHRPWCLHWRLVLQAASDVHPVAFTTTTVHVHKVASWSNLGFHYTEFPVTVVIFRVNFGSDGLSCDKFWQWLSIAVIVFLGTTTFIDDLLSDFLLNMWFVQVRVAGHEWTSATWHQSLDWWTVCSWSDCASPFKDCLPCVSTFFWPTW